MPKYAAAGRVEPDEVPHRIAGKQHIARRGEDSKVSAAETRIFMGPLDGSRLVMVLASADTLYSFTINEPAK